MPDVNVYVYAHRPDTEQADEYRTWLEHALCGPEHVGVSELVLSSFVRIVTNHRVFREPTPPDVALDFAATVLGARRAIPITAGQRHWRVFSDLCRTVRARGNIVPDAYIAALAIDSGATLVTNDHGFARFPGLAWRRPLDGSSASR